MNSTRKGKNVALITLDKSEPPKAELPPEPGTFSANVLLQKHKAKMATSFVVPSAPADSFPSLDGAGADMDLSTADQLHQMACRWLEYIESQLAPVEAAALEAKETLKSLKSIMKFKYPKPSDASPAEVEKMAELASAQVELAAQAVILRGKKNTLMAVKTAASRCVTRHTKTNL